ncbi:15-hydroxyprostaglandin dehydrogenase [NAD(+)]-like [Myzus persicae]|uniref:15-hydroxyprostaglandin dehydrogenase [NAD(+)]-like n=1 Tax=Myzus persicae TaxID=13164 RepID=UPI000B938743|nr:15-hydroxyprostaglandin dehydrogenase [NAD(+)]-like [Myzus persicae]XP_022167970.1 15-hydroxyprostaglandin dehydrogenase [NAD(+)]-like [Myzus persicae]XP_022167971.1 15-hydroxyprostaglandin dehydrogenase [NAD(+)]-like [Myzus persicae]XP_022167972.1 15-hydroxyprostaglandin dehydrogenase [NAD(+)]-like [Myzus persicae]XP_022167973.1 15-hydroxyprostaglandin dehydrogenase [NAD(+)]-like [Myzus persicae]
MGLENQVALVTGAASNIGYAYVKCLLLNKVKVLLCDINVDECQVIAHQFQKEFQNINIFSTKCDVTNEDEFENAFKTCIKHFGRLDIVINNAGVFDNSIERRWSTTVNINYGGVVKGTLLAIKYMGISNGGSGGTVIQTSSLLVYSDSYHCSPMYLSTKKYLMEFTKSFGKKNHFSLHGVKIITLCPESTTTNCVSSVCKNETLHKTEECVEELEDLKNSQQSKKMQKPDNVGNALITILEHGKTGETWIVEDNKPPRLIE